MRKFFDTMRGHWGFVLCVVAGGFVFWSINTVAGDALIARLLGR